ncbi:MAG: hypothetical protein EAZ32_14310 [Cytophagia bacterium]|nr:MAG: hypothetical protein EAZ38_15310 [Cytophagales bacterium]TAG37774.1 MAG: hypothetical protein EAZ32_14310 [Cytophagia bacterium]TAG50795.1 MAG: hypothetical protein EAZ29_11670 [Runella slithyformis]TAG78993.1 MAG: hypothetical protein EAZ22_12450 [Cytophagales bacterium]
MKRFIRHLMIAAGLMSMATGVFAQMPHDVVYMPKKTACVALSYGSSSWNEYWENTLKRENLNIGTHTTTNAMLMVAAGVTDKLNVIVGLPYVQTKASAGNLMGQKGIQDLSVWLKYKAVESKGLSLHLAGGVSTPASNYVPDFLPMSIGLQCRIATGRVILNYTHKSGLYFTGHGSYSYRSNIKVDRDAYQADGRVYNTNEVRVPNATDAAARLGLLKKKFQVEAFVEQFSCVGGDNIRRNDMPFPTNNMRMVSVGGYAKFQPKRLGVNARFAQVTSGLNVGQSASYSVGLLWIIAPKSARQTVPKGA